MWKPWSRFPLSSNQSAATAVAPTTFSNQGRFVAQTVERQDRKCVPSLTPCRTSLQIRIVGGRSSYEGRVEVQVGSKWGTVCSTGWTTREAMVACRQLGLGYSMHAITVSRTWRDLFHMWNKFTVYKFKKKTSDGSFKTNQCICTGCFTHTNTHLNNKRSWIWINKWSLLNI